MIDHMTDRNDQWLGRSLMALRQLEFQGPTRFEMVTDFMQRYQMHEAGGSELTEWWIPAEDLEDLNDHIVGPIELVAEVGG